MDDESSSVECGHCASMLWRGKRKGLRPRGILPEFSRGKTVPVSFTGLGCTDSSLGLTWKRRKEVWNAGQQLPRPALKREGVGYSVRRTTRRCRTTLF